MAQPSKGDRVTENQRTTERVESTAVSPLLSVRQLVKHFPVRGGILRRTSGQVHAVDDVSFDVYPGETLGLVGESGCGKTTVGRTLLRIVPPTSGTIVFDGHDLATLKGNEPKAFRRAAQMIFQDPFSSLDPRVTVGETIGEGLRIHGIGSRAERVERVREIMNLVGMRPYYTQRYPHEFSGGQRQRIGIARALILHPKLVVCDEPVSALDVSIQSQILNLLKDLQKQLSLTYLFIAHNLAVIRYISDRVGVMYLGKLVEIAPTEELFDRPLHPYTQALMSAIPAADPARREARNRIILVGDVPSPIDPPSGCRFHTRCPLAIDICREIEPRLKQYGEGHTAACHLIDAHFASQSATSAAR
jgi:oligopeptide transport system ATP-binding protein